MGPSTKAANSVTTASPGQMRKKRLATKRTQCGSLRQLCDTRKPLMEKKISTPTLPSALLPNSGSGRPFNAYWWLNSTMKAANTRRKSKLLCLAGAPAIPSVIAKNLRIWLKIWLKSGGAAAYYSRFSQVKFRRDSGETQVKNRPLILSELRSRNFCSDKAMSSAVHYMDCCRATDGFSSPARDENCICLAAEMPPCGVMSFSGCIVPAKAGTQECRERRF